MGVFFERKEEMAQPSKYLAGQCLKLQKKLAAAVLKCGPKHVWLDPEQKATIAKARSREDIRGLITDGVVKHKVHPTKPKAHVVTTQTHNRIHAIRMRKQEQHRRKQIREFHRQRHLAREEFKDTYSIFPHLKKE